MSFDAAYQTFCQWVRLQQPVDPGLLVLLDRAFFDAWASDIAETIRGRTRTRPMFFEEARHRPAFGNQTDVLRVLAYDHRQRVDVLHPVPLLRPSNMAMNLAGDANGIRSIERSAALAITLLATIPLHYGAGTLFMHLPILTQRGEILDFGPNLLQRFRDIEFSAVFTLERRDVPESSQCLVRRVFFGMSSPVGSMLFEYPELLDLIRRANRQQARHARQLKHRFDYYMVG